MQFGLVTLRATLKGESGSRNEGISETVAHSLRKMIIIGELSEGVPLNKSELGVALQCSEVELAEAIQSACQQHLVETPPGEDYFVPRIGAVEFQQLVEAQSSMTQAWVEVAAERINEEQMTQMRHIVAKQEEAAEAADSYALAELDYQFHTLIAAASGNPYFLDAAIRLHSRLARCAYKTYQAADSSVAPEAILGHKAIIDALEKGDANLAKQMVNKHISEGGRRIPEILEFSNELEGSEHSERD